MAKFEPVESGIIALIMQDENERIIQLGVTQEQSDMIQILLASISRESAFVKMGEEHDLVLKSKLCKKCSLK